MKSTTFFVLCLILATALNSFEYKNNGPKFGSFTDPRDGQEYTTVKLGKQTWFAENLNFATEKSWCKNCETYGRLYTFEDAKTACPEGWHLPTVAEWNELINYLGGGIIAGGKMKSADMWRIPNTGADNSSGFSAIPTPRRSTDGTIERPYDAVWWTADKALEPAAWTISIEHDNAGVFQYGYYRVSGFCVRCIKD